MLSADKLYNEVGLTSIDISEPDTVGELEYVGEVVVLTPIAALDADTGPPALYRPTIVEWVVGLLIPPIRNKGTLPGAFM